MHNKTVDNYLHALEFIPDCYMVQEMCYKIVNTHSSTIELVPECCKTQKMCDKPFNKSFLAFFYTLDQYETQNMCDRIITVDPFSLRYAHYQYNIQKMFDKTVDDCLPALKFVPDWFVKSKTIKVLFAALYADKNILYFHEDSSNVMLNCYGMGIRDIDLSNINLSDTNYEKDNPDTIIHVRVLTWHVKFGNPKELKKKINEELMSIALHPKR